MACLHSGVAFSPKSEGVFLILPHKLSVMGHLGSVATRLMCGGIFHNSITRNLLLSLPVKEFSKSVSI